MDDGEAVSLFDFEIEDVSTGGVVASGETAVFVVVRDEFGLLYYFLIAVQQHTVLLVVEVKLCKSVRLHNFMS